MKSRAVKEELSYAHYCYVNSDSTHPNKLIPALIEQGVAPPVLIEHFTRLDLTVVKTGLTRLLGQLGLEKKAPAASATGLKYALPDPNEILLSYARKNPTPGVE